jgi:O-antigen ligase
MFIGFLNFRIFIHMFIYKTSTSKEIASFIITLLIVVIFILCHIPRLVLNFYEALDSENIGQCGPPVWSMIFHVFSNSLLPVINSTSNFFIYFLAGKNFKSSLFRMLKCRKETEESVFSKSSVVFDIDSDFCEEVKEMTEMEELENTKLLRI